MKKSFLVAFMFAFVAVSTAVMMPSKSEAIPAFARQVGMACSACHFQHFPKLNAFGRAFKLGGFTDVGEQELIEDDHMSLPVVMNTAFVTKVRYQKSSPVVAAVGGNTGTDRGEIQFPDEAAAWFAGRMAEHWGAAVEFPGPAVSMKFVFSMPVAFGKAGVSFFTTDALGASFGMEIFNTALQRSVRGFEDRGAVYAVQATGVGSGIATGATLFAGGDMFFVAAGLWGPSTGNTTDTGLNLSYNYRLAFTPQFAGFDAMIGIFGQGGKTKITNLANTPAPALVLVGTVATVETKAFGIDFQAQGEVGGMTLEVQGQYVSAGSTPTAVDTVSLYTKANSYSFNAEIGILPVAGLQLAYMNYDDKTVAGALTGDRKATTLGVYYEMAQNVELMVNYSMHSGLGRGQKSLLTVMLETAF